MISPTRSRGNVFLGGDVAIRGVAQFGRALRSGRRGPRFKSGRPDFDCDVWSRRIIGIAPVSKTGAREGVWVRIPPAPLCALQVIDLGGFSYSKGHQDRQVMACDIEGSAPRKLDKVDPLAL